MFLEGFEIFCVFFSSGIALGGLVGGAIYDRYGGAAAWRTFGVSAGIAAILYFCSSTLFLRRKKRDGKQPLDPGSMQDTSILSGGTSGYETPIPPDTPSEQQRLTA